LQTTRVVIAGGELALKKSFECLRACSDFKLATTDEDEYGVKPRSGNWHDVPDVAGDAEAAYRIETNRGTWLATGYARILTLGRTEYVEVEADQVQKRSFALDPKSSGESYNTYVTPCGMWARNY